MVTELQSWARELGELANRRIDHLTREERELLFQVASYLYGAFSEENKPYSMIWGRIKLRGDNGPTGEYGRLQYFIRLGDKIFPFSNLQDGPPLLDSQLSIITERPI